MSKINKIRRPAKFPSSRNGKRSFTFPSTNSAGKDISVTISFIQEISRGQAKKCFEKYISRVQVIANETGVGKKEGDFSSVKWKVKEKTLLGRTSIKKTETDVLEYLERKKELVEDQPYTYSESRVIDLQRRIDNIKKNIFPPEKTNVSPTFDKSFEEDAFDANLEKARNVVKSMRESHVSFQKEALNEHKKLWEKLNQDNIHEIKKDFYNKGNTLRKKIKENNKELNESLRRELHALTKKYRNCKNNKLKKEFRVKLEKFQQEKNCYALVTHPSHSVDRKIVLAQACVIKRLDTAQKAPKNFDFEKIYNDLIEELDEKKDAAIQSLEDAKKEYKKPGELAWGEDCIARALCYPANWLPKEEAGIRFSRHWEAYVTVTEVSPLYEDEDYNHPDAPGGVPAGLRNDSRYPEYSKRPANCQMTTTYILNDEGKPDDTSKHIAFRIAELPTVEAAGRALELMKQHYPGMTVLHDNCLLTPTLYKEWLYKGRPDRNLFFEHENNIREVMGADNFMLTNFGVNEGAVGEFAGLQLGWHLSMKYNNRAALQFNNRLKEQLNLLKLPELEEKELEEKKQEQKSQIDLDHLGSLVYVCQELEAIWARNDYASANVGDNPVKAPALWRVACTLCGIPSNTHCMSAKDRASVVEAYSCAMLHEMHMNLSDHKRALEVEFKDLPEEMKSKLFLGCFTRDDIEVILKNDNLEQAIQNKIEQAIQCLRVNEGLFQQKELPLFPSLSAYTHFISTSTPIRDTNRANTDAFPQFVFDSIYDANHMDSRSSPDEEITTSTTIGKKILENQHQIKKQLRTELIEALRITKENTSIPGDKLRGGVPLKRFYSGFDRRYVLRRLSSLDKGKESKFLREFNHLLGLEQVDKKTRRKFRTLAIRALRIYREGEKRTASLAWLSLFNDVEDVLYESFRPQTKVKD